MVTVGITLLEALDLRLGDRLQDQSASRVEMGSSVKPLTRRALQLFFNANPLHVIRFSCVSN